MPGQNCPSDLVFRLSCWGLGIVAFGQLLAAGVAVSVRMEKAREVRVVEKYIDAPPRIITVPAKPEVVMAPAPQAAPVLPPPIAPDPAPLPPPRPLGVPAIADPIVERLVVEARKARLASDAATAVIKLEEAREKAPDDANVLFETGLLFEEMAAYDSRHVDAASDAYQAVLTLGAEKAGSLFEMAGRKLGEGLAMPADMRDELRIGRVRIFKDDQFKDGERTVLTVPVQAAPGVSLGTDFMVGVEFYDTLSVNGKKQIVARSPDPQLSFAKDEWATAPIDFQGGEELLRVTYILPTQSEQQSELFGKRSYYGQVVKLFYKGELIDSYPWPRHLASMNFGSAEPQQPQDQLPPMDDETPVFLGAEDIIDPLSGSLLPPIPGANEPPPKMPDLNAAPGVPPLPR